MDPVTRTFRVDVGLSDAGVRGVAFAAGSIGFRSYGSTQASRERSKLPRTHFLDGMKNLRHDLLTTQGRDDRRE